MGKTEIRKKTIIAFSKLGQILSHGIENIILKEAAQKSVEDNSWFDLESINFALMSLSSWLTEGNLITFTSRYKINKNQKNIAIICAGNIPAVGFHDMLCVLLSANTIQIKLSSDDKYLLPAIAKILTHIEPLLEERIRFVQKIEKFDAVIATGSNNTSRYFEYYFGKYPNIIRCSRTSVSVLDNNDADYSLLAKDILEHKGLGCRNVSKLFIPNGFDLSRLNDAFKEYYFLLNHNKYRNNYDYHKAIYIMNNIAFYDFGNCLFIESKELFSAVSVVNFEYYDDIEHVTNFIKHNEDKIQCISSNILNVNNFIPLGKAQEPTIFDFADNIDTMKFLSKI